MKKVVSLMLSLVIFLSVFSVLGVTVSAAKPSDVMYVKSTNFSGGKVTYNVYLKKNINLIGTIVKVVYDPAVLKPVKGGAHSSAASVNGLFVADKVKNSKNAYSMAFVSMDTYKVGSSDKAFMTVTFERISKSYPKTSVKFYCVEFNTADTKKKIEKNDKNPPLITSFSTSTLNKTTYVGVSCVEKGLKLQWKATPGATGYYIYKHDGKDFVRIKTVSSKTLAYTDTTVKANTSGKYAVRSYNSAGIDSGYNGSVSGYYIKSPGKVALSAQPTGIKVGWTKVTGATGYRIYRRVINSDGTRSAWTYLKDVKSVNTLTYIDKSNLKSGTYYEYTVRSYNAKGISAVYKYASLRYFPAPKVTVSGVTGGVKISWNTISGAKKYNVYRKYSGETKWTLIKTVSSSVKTYTDKTAISGKTINYMVKAVGSNGSSSYIAKKISYVAVPHLTSITNVVGGIQIKWNGISKASGYRVYRRAAGEKSWTYLKTVTSTSYTDKNVKSGTYYKYTVRAVVNKVYSAYEDGLLIKYVAVPKLTSISNVSSGINIKWKAVTGATEYRVYRRGAGEKTWTYLTTVKTTQYTDKKVSKGNYYRYTVRAVGSYYSGTDHNGLVIKR